MLKRGDIVVCQIPQGPQNVCHDSCDGGVGIVTLYENYRSVFLVWLTAGPRRYEHREGDIFVPEEWLTKVGEVPNG